MNKIKKIILVIFIIFGFSICRSFIINNNKKVIFDTTIVNSSCYLTSYGKTHITANGIKINKLKGIPAIIAVSPDLLLKFPMGSNVYIYINDSCKLNGTYSIQDKMASVYKNKIDILVEANYKKLPQAKDIHCYEKIKLIKINIINSNNLL